MHMIEGAPLQGAWREKLEQFLQTCGLRYDPGIEYTFILADDDGIAATGSLDGSTLKCIAVSPAHQGQDLTAQVMTALLQQAVLRRQDHLMLYTKPQNQYLFQGFGFHSIIRTARCLLMENKRDGLQRYLAALPKPENAKPPVGCIVAHCNPFTLGHRYLIEQAARECAWVHVFILSEDKGLFSPDDRLRMAQEGCQDLKNVRIHPTGPYMISAATFPTYFIKDLSQAEDIYCEADIRLFAEKIAPPLGITRRYVGTEPHSPVTARYNEEMRRLLPGYGIELCEVERIRHAGSAISASRVRALLQAGDTQALGCLLPNSSVHIIQQKQGGAPCPTPTECKKT